MKPESSRGPPSSFPLALLGVACLVSTCARDRARTSQATFATPKDEAAPFIPGQEGDDAPLTTLRPPPPAGAARAALLAEVERELAVMKTSIYSHRARIDETAGAFDYDCSGLLDYALSRAAPDALAAVQATTSRRPRSSDYVAFLSTIPIGSTKGRWVHVGRAKDLLPGDVIAWLKPPESSSSNTGHTMIVHGAVTPDSEEPGAIVVPIVDSTEHPHVPGDVRAAAHRTGLGQGEIVLITDMSGRPVGYRWSRGARSREKTTAIALGRLQ